MTLPRVIIPDYRFVFNPNRGPGDTNWYLPPQAVEVEVLSLHLQKETMRVRIVGTNKTFDTGIDPFLNSYTITEK